MKHLFIIAILLASCSKSTPKAPVHYSVDSGFSGNDKPPKGWVKPGQ